MCIRDRYYLDDKHALTKIYRKYQMDLRASVQAILQRADETIKESLKRGGDYVNKMLELAGGDYPFADLEPDQGGNTKMTVEEFYQGAVDADVLIYDNTSDVSVSTVADILANGDYLADMKAIREGNVWGIQDRKSTRLNSSHIQKSRMPSSA